MSAIVLRRSSESTWSQVVERLRGSLFEAVRDVDREDGPRATQIRLLIDEARRMRRGAFAHWSHHPVVRAVLLPFGGIGAVALIEILVALSR